MTGMQLRRHSWKLLSQSRRSRWSPRLALRSSTSNSA